MEPGLADQENGAKRTTIFFTPDKLQWSLVWLTRKTVEVASLRSGGRVLQWSLVWLTRKTAVRALRGVR